MRRTSIQSLLGIGLLILACAGCGGDGGSVAGTFTEPNDRSVIAGEWATSATEIVDTCGFDPLPSYSPLLVEENGDTVVFTFADGYGNCEESVRTRSGDTVTLTRTDTLDAGCAIIRVQSNITYEFSDSGLSGLATHQYSVLSGACANLPCTYQLAIGGNRCEGCWPGCAEVFDATAGPAAESAGSSDRLDRLPR